MSKSYWRKTRLPLLPEYKVNSMYSSSPLASKPKPFNGSDQGGAVLIVSMIILLILSFLAVQGTQTATVEEKMAGNFRNKKVAFEGAEAALLAAEEWLQALELPPQASTSGENGILIFGATEVRDPSSWDTGKAWVHKLEESQEYLPGAEAPRWVIEERQKVINATGGNAESGSNSRSSSNGDIYSYRITAMGTGTTENSVVVLRSHYERVF